jgi:hypothetical protein
MKKGRSIAREEQQKELIQRIDSEFGNRDYNSEELIHDVEDNEVEMQNYNDEFIGDGSGGNSWNNSIEILNRDTSNIVNLKKLKASERSHFQCNKILIIFSSIIILMFVSILRKNLFQDALFYVEKCSYTDIIICCLFLVTLLSLLMVSVRTNRDEYNMKRKVNYEFVKGDIHWESKVTVPMVIIAILGKFISG